jgi:ABC-type phosphate/phosphonate transport system ATPase subunit
MNRSVSPVITLDHVSNVFAGRRDVDGVSPTIHPGPFVAISGRSGAGRTLLSPAAVATAGALRFAGEG